MPSLKSLRTLCDKMKNLATTITICCASSGDLSFIVETDSAIVVSRYFNLMLDQMTENNCNVMKDGQLPEICCTIDTKQLSLCFGSIQVKFMIIICFLTYEPKLYVVHNASNVFLLKPKNQCTFRY